MAQEDLIIGDAPNDKLGEGLRDAMLKIGRMFTELYKEKEDIVNSTESGVPVVFETPFPNGTEYELHITCYANGSPVGFAFTDKTEAGFTAISSEPAIFIYRTITL